MVKRACIVNGPFLIVVYNVRRRRVVWTLLTTTDLAFHSTGVSQKENEFLL